METHHPKVEKKKFKEYFFEFLMIFIAVSLGFIAENLRESISENSKARELAENLYQETLADSVAIRNTISVRNRKLQELAYYVRYVKDSNLARLSPGFARASYWSFIVTSSIYFEPKDGTINQLIHSGALRYYKSRQLQSDIAAVTVAMTNLRKRQDQELEFSETYVRKFAISYFDIDWAERLYRHAGVKTSQVTQFLDGNPGLFPASIRNLKNFSRDDASSLAGYWLLLIRATISNQYEAYTDANHQLLETLRKEYGLQEKK